MSCFWGENLLNIQETIRTWTGSTFLYYFSFTVVLLCTTSAKELLCPVLWGSFLCTSIYFTEVLAGGIPFGPFAGVCIKFYFNILSMAKLMRTFFKGGSCHFAFLILTHLFSYVLHIPVRLRLRNLVWEIFSYMPRGETEFDSNTALLHLLLFAEM